MTQSGHSLDGAIQQGLLVRKLAVNGAGAVAVVNSTFRLSQTSHIWLFRGQAAGR